MADLVVMWVAHTLPSLNSDGDDQKNAGGEGKVTAALDNVEDESDEVICEAKMKWKNQKIAE